MTPTEFSQKLLEWRQGDRQALDQVMDAAYAELRRLAARQLASDGNQTLSATGLVNEAYLRLVRADVSYQDRAHFIAMAARLMRRILVDFARARGRRKRGGPARAVTLDTSDLGVAAPAPDILDVDRALERLSALDARKTDVIELNFFGGLTNEEIAVTLGVSVSTVERDLKFSKAWLRRELAG